jgi:hypothetical protein
MHEESVLINRELYQAYKCDGGNRDVQNQGLSHVDLIFQNIMKKHVLDI